MAVRAMNFKLEDRDITDIRRVAMVYNMTMTDVIREAIHEYLEKVKRDPFYRLTANVEEASEEETAEILEEIEGLSDDDLTISSVKKFSV